MALQPSGVPSRAAIQAAIDEAVAAASSATEWQSVTFQNGWGTTSFIRYGRDAANNLHIQGRLTTLGASGSVAFTLAEGFRPSFPAGDFVKFTASPQSTVNTAKINIGSTGTVAIYYDDSAGTPTYISIDIVVSLS